MFGDVSADEAQAEAGNIRMIAVLADKRLDGKLAHVLDRQGAGLRPAVAHHPRLLHGPEGAGRGLQGLAGHDEEDDGDEGIRDAARRSAACSPSTSPAPELDAFVKKQVGEYRKLADEFGLVKK